mmetsp:Transcript_12824/g.15688  ORF Transcript_12824/g.15688 Transcript_12824/m.15688 type:complete len:85 (-) Transcript_12824:68-322(-)
MIFCYLITTIQNLNQLLYNYYQTPNNNIVPASPMPQANASFASYDAVKDMAYNPSVVGKKIPMHKLVGDMDGAVRPYFVIQHIL